MGWVLAKIASGDHESGESATATRADTVRTEIVGPIDARCNDREIAAVLRTRSVTAQSRAETGCEGECGGNKLSTSRIRRKETCLIGPFGGVYIHVFYTHSLLARFLCAPSSLNARVLVGISVQTSRPAVERREREQEDGKYQSAEA